MSNSILEMKQCWGDCGALVRDGDYCEECLQLGREYAEAESTVVARVVKGRLEWSDLDRKDVGVVPMRRWRSRLALIVLGVGAVLEIALCCVGVMHVWRMLAR
jgi:hypothetical protein